MAAIQEFFSYEAQELQGLRARYNAIAIQGQVIRSKRPKGGEKDQFLIANALTDNDNGPITGWIPSRSAYLSRIARPPNDEAARSTTLPFDFPLSLEGARVWLGQDFKDESKYVVPLHTSDITEIENALSSFKVLGPDSGLEHVSQSTFPLPNLGVKLEEISRTLHTGRGFVVLRGLDPSRYTAWENAIVYLGVTSHIAEKRGCQDRFGNMLVHIKDMGARNGQAIKRQSHYTSKAQPFHNDYGDIVAMYALDSASMGGESLLASSGEVYNEIACTRPDVVRTLADPFWNFERSTTPPTYDTRAVLFNNDLNGPFFCFSRRKLTGSADFPLSQGIPPMSEAQAEALDMVHFVAEKKALSLKLQRGDIQLFNNLAVLHARHEFSDDDKESSHLYAPRSKRHLVRLWLRNENRAWKLPESLAVYWFEVFGKSERMAKRRYEYDAKEETEHIITRKMTC